ncbi:MAG TPA: toll/interleukin-1 receptor domain-containing protein [Thermoanaerobaculia bacterium]|nr:toll/interleukin-1 receptor domain-containing protein [Thermoanaerobaculia bacterium]
MSPGEQVPVILQWEGEDGGFECAGFTGLPVVNPILIVLAHAGSPDSIANAAALREELIRELTALAPEVKKEDRPCEDPARLEPSCRRVLLPVGSATAALEEKPWFAPWLALEPFYLTLPVFPLVARQGVTKLLPKGFSRFNVEFWSRSIADALPAVFALAGLTSESARIFISYRQKESAALAIQLFDALAHENFDVFLDHFRIAPGVDFQTRLTQELGDKSMVLLLESAGILDSEWTLYEINVAKTCGLGLFALQPPGGRSVPGVEEPVRRRLADGDFAGGSFSASAVLEPAVLSDVVERVKREHDRALVQRRQALRLSLQGALWREKVYGHYFDEFGILHVPIQEKSLEYRVWLTPRPPDLPDFHTTSQYAQAPVRGVVIGLSRLMEPLRMQRTGWLAGLCHIELVDEGQLLAAAGQMARGEL